MKTATQSWFSIGCPGSTVMRCAACGREFDLEGMTALVTDQMLEVMGLAGTADECRQGLAERARSSDRQLLGAPVVATDPARVRQYHDAILDVFAPG